jgi:hypothetical protein
MHIILNGVQGRHNPLVCQGMPPDLRCGWESCQNSIYTPGHLFPREIRGNEIEKKRKLMIAFLHTGFAISLGYLELEHLQRSPETASDPIFRRWNSCFGLQWGSDGGPDFKCPLKI